MIELVEAGWDNSEAGPPTYPSERADGGFTDAELTVLALAADPDGQLDPDAIPLAEYTEGRQGPLPTWYMPAPMARGGSRWRRTLVLLIVVSFLVIDAFGLCITYGQLVLA